MVCMLYSENQRGSLQQKLLKSKKGVYHVQMPHVLANYLLRESLTSKLTVGISSHKEAQMF